MGLNHDPANRRTPEWTNMTKAEYDRWQVGKSRNLTDAPLGGTSAKKRSADAMASHAVTEVLGGVFSVKPSTTPCPDPCDCEFCFTRRDKANARVRQLKKYYRNKARMEGRR